MSSRNSSEQDNRRPYRETLTVEQVAGWFKVPADLVRATYRYDFPDPGKADEPFRAYCIPDLRDPEPDITIG